MVVGRAVAVAMAVVANTMAAAVGWWKRHSGGGGGGGAGKVGCGRWRPTHGEGRVERVGVWVVVAVAEMAVAARVALAVVMLAAMVAGATVWC